MTLRQIISERKQKCSFVQLLTPIETFMSHLAKIRKTGKNCLMIISVGVKR